MLVDSAYGTARKFKSLTVTIEVYTCILAIGILVRTLESFTYVENSITLTSIV